ncbi:tail fiber protein [Oscillatoria amoena NRMC-F 0135]|nr:tail fiber protein [Oscillatoria amoena NRMC-F 0135]
MEGYIGEVRLFAGNFAPRAWMLCQGQSLSIAEYTPLYAIIGTMYGGDGQQSFLLPDLRGRRAVHSGNSTGPGLQPIYIGEVGGYEQLTLTSSQMPAHSHQITATMTGSATLNFANDSAVAGVTPQNNFFAISSENFYAPNPDTALASASVTTNLSSMSLSVSGGSQPIPMVTPYLALNYIICLEGIFPSRN